MYSTNIRVLTATMELLANIPEFYYNSGQEKIEANCTKHNTSIYTERPNSNGIN